MIPYKKRDILETIIKYFTRGAEEAERKAVAFQPSNLIWVIPAEGSVLKVLTAILALRLVAVFYCPSGFPGRRKNDDSTGTGKKRDCHPGNE